MRSLVSLLWLALLSLLSLLSTSTAILHGDEQYTRIEGGHFWTFHAAGLSIINPETCLIEHEIRADTRGNFLPSRWADGVYMQNDPNGLGTVGYLLIGSGETTYDGMDNPRGEVLVFSTQKQKVVTRLPTKGGSHMHSYSVHNEYWTQGMDGKLYAIELDVFGSLLTPIVTRTRSIELTETIFALQAPTGTGGGTNRSDETNNGRIGQILWDEDPYLERHGYISSRGAFLHIVDLETKQQVAVFDFSRYLDQGECTSGGGYGRGMAYAGLSKHLFFQCGRHGPVLELDLGQSPLQPTFVAKHNISGFLHEIMDNVIIAVDKRQNKVHILETNTPGQASSIEYSVDVPGHPDRPTVYTSSSDGHTTICMPLTENINRNDRDYNGDNIACDAFSCGPPQTPRDVAAGMCFYDPADNNRTLLRAPLADFQKVRDEEPPYLDRCPRCKKRDSYYGGDICTCTPHCGSCGTPRYNREDLNKTGVRCVSLNQVLSSNNNQNTAAAAVTLIPGAGAVQQEPPRFWEPQCSYGWTHRDSKRGGRYQASVSHIPANSLQIINMDTQTHRCEVDLPGKPDRVLYVPPQLGSSSSGKTVAMEQEEEQMERGIFIAVGIILANIVMVGVVLAVHNSRRRMSSAQQQHSPKVGLDQTTAADLELSPPRVEEDEQVIDPLPQIA